MNIRYPTRFSSLPADIRCAKLKLLGIMLGAVVGVSLIGQTDLRPKASGPTLSGTVATSLATAESPSIQAPDSIAGAFFRLNITGQGMEVLTFHGSTWTRTTLGEETMRGTYTYLRQTADTGLALLVVTNIPDLRLDLYGGELNDAFTFTFSDVASGSFGNTNGVIGQITGSFTAPSLVGIPDIGLQPRSQIVAEGVNVSFAMDLRGQPPLAIQWTKDGVPISGATNNTHSISNVQFSNAGSYAVTISNSLGAIVSVPASLAVVNHFVGNVVGWGDSGQSRLDIPASVTNATANAVAMSGGQVHSVALREDGTAVTWGNPTPTLAAGLNGVVQVGAGDSISIALKAEGTPAYHDRSSTSRYGFPPRPQRHQLTNIVAISVSGENTLALRSDGTLVGWGFDGYGHNAVNSNGVPGISNNVIQVACGKFFGMALKADGSVVTWNSSAEGNVIRNQPPGLTNIIRIAAGVGHALALRADGTVVSWGSNRVGPTVTGQTNVPPDLSTVVNISAGEGHSVALKSDGTIVAWGRSATGGNATVGLTGVAAIESGENHVLALVRTVSWLQPVAITQQPVTQAIAIGGTLNLSVTASGTSPLFYQWKRNGTNLVGQTAPSLVITNASAAALGDYEVWVSNFAAVRPSVRIPVVLATPPSITANATNATVVPGATASFNVSAAGTPPLAYQWRFNGTPLPQATAGGLTLTNVSPAQAGSYDVIVSNVAGSVTSSPPALLTVLLPPAITTPPIGQWFSSGQTVTLHVAATGDNLAYQWQLNGTNLPGATGGTLILTNAGLSTTGRYTVVVSNSAGSTTSVPAVLRFFGDLKQYAGMLLSGETGDRYRLEFANVIAGTTNWLTLTNLVMPGGFFLYVDPDSPGRPQRYYRAVLEP